MKKDPRPSELDCFMYIDIILLSSSAFVFVCVGTLRPSQYCVSHVGTYITFVS